MLGGRCLERLDLLHRSDCCVVEGFLRVTRFVAFLERPSEFGRTLRQRLLGVAQPSFRVVGAAALGCQVGLLGGDGGVRLLERGVERGLARLERLDCALHFGEACLGFCAGGVRSSECLFECEQFTILVRACLLELEDAVVALEQFVLELQDLALLDVEGLA